MVDLGTAKPTLDQLDISARRGFAALGLFLESVEHLDRFDKLHRVDGPVSITIEIIHQLNGPSVKSLQNLG